MSLKPTAANFIDPLPPLGNSEGLLGRPLRFVLRIDGARGLVAEVPNRNVFVRYNFCDGEAARHTPMAEGKQPSPQFDYHENVEINEVTEPLLRYLQRDAICFDVWGEPDEVAEQAAAGGGSGAVMEMPPETFEFFVGVDVHEATDELGEQFEHADLQVNMTVDGKAGFHLTASRARQIVVSIGQQADTHFRVSRVARAWLGALRDEYGNVWDESWLPLRIDRQCRSEDGESYQMQLEWVVSPAVLSQSAALRQVFYLELKLEVTEVERLVLDAPVLLSKRINATFHAKVREARRGSILGGTRRDPGVLRRRSLAAPGGEGDASVLVRGANGSEELVDLQRLRLHRMTSAQQVWMGQWEVPEAAVAQALTEMRSAAAATSSRTSGIVSTLDADVERLGRLMLDEQQRQAEELNLALAAKLQAAVGDNIKEVMGMDAIQDHFDADQLQKDREEQLVDLRAERLRLQRELEAAKADAADAAAKAAKRVAALEADLNEARARSGKAAADAGAGKSKLCTIM